MIANLLEAYRMAIKSGDDKLADKLAEIIVASFEPPVTIPVYPTPWQPHPNYPTPWQSPFYYESYTTCGGIS